jgi:outer membrane biosynthesis protein TonB
MREYTFQLTGGARDKVIANFDAGGFDHYSQQFKNAVPASETGEGTPTCYLVQLRLSSSQLAFYTSRFPLFGVKVSSKDWREFVKLSDGVGAEIKRLGLKKCTVEPEPIAPEPEPVAPEPEPVAPEPEPIAPEPEPIAPEPEPIAPEPEPVGSPPSRNRSPPSRNRSPQSRNRSPPSRNRSPQSRNRSPQSRRPSRNRSSHHSRPSQSQNHP